MTQIPTVGFAVLGLLARGRRTGYQLASLMRDPVAFFWAAPHSQIYPQLAALESAGLITHETSAGPGPQAKKTYAITATGRSALSAWVSGPLAPRPAKDELTLRAYTAWTADADAAAERFAAEARNHRERLATYRQIETELVRRWGDGVNDPGRPEFGNYSAVAAGIGAEREVVRWCDWMVRRLRRI